MRRFVLVLCLLVLLSAFSVSVMAQSEVVHVVQSGENLFRISLKYNVSMASIAQRNGITNWNLVFAGQQLVIPGTSGGTTNPPPATTQPPSTETSYTVVRGDTLGNIARRFNTTVQAIAQRNSIANPNLIYPGQVLIISGSGGTTPPPGPVPTSAPPVTGGFELGGHVFTFSYPSQMKAAGMTWAKTQIRWDGSAPASIAQGAIDAARSNGFKILLGVVGDKAQLAANPTQYYQNFANFLAGVAQLNPDAIEVWNEQNIDREWSSGQISGGAYTQMLSAAYQAIKRANGNVMVISGAPAPTGFFGGGCTAAGCDDAPYLRQMAQAGAAQFMDCVGIHYNEGIISPTRSSGDPRGNSGHYTRYYPTMVSTYNSIFPSKPLCFTELGYLSPEGFSPLPGGFSWASNVTQQDQALWLAEAATLSKRSGRVRLMIVWNVDSTVYGEDPQAGYAIIRPNATCPACATLGAAVAAP